VDRRGIGAVRPAGSAVAGVTKTQVTRRLRLWQRRLGLTDWKIEIRFVAPEDGARATAEASPEYRECIFEFDPARFPPLEELDDWIVHELCHMITWELAYLAELFASDEQKVDVADKAHERLTTDIERMVMRLWREHAKKPRKRKAA